jgi:hypothetical protein
VRFRTKFKKAPIPANQGFAGLASEDEDSAAEEDRGSITISPLRGP